MMAKAEDISNRPTRKGCRTLCAAALCLFLLFCQLFVQLCGNVRENLQLVGLHQQLVAGTGVEDAFDETLSEADRNKIKTGPAVWKLFHTAGPFLFKTFLL